MLNVTVPVGVAPVPTFDTVAVRMMGSVVVLPPMALRFTFGTASLTVTSGDVTVALA